MAKRRNDNPDPLDVASDTATLDSEPRAQKIRKGVFVPLTEDGSLDVSRIKGDKGQEIERAKAALFGTEVPSESAPVIKIDRNLIPVLCDGYAALLQTGTRFLKWPAEAREMIAFDAAAKERLSEPVGAYLDKLAPKFLTKNPELMTMLLAIGLETRAVLINAMTNYQLKMGEKQEGTGASVQ